MIDFFVKLDARSSLAGHSVGAELKVPLTQVSVGRFLGMTAVHVNRTRRVLVETGKVKLRHRSVKLGPELRERSHRLRAAYIEV